MLVLVVIAVMIEMRAGSERDAAQNLAKACGLDREKPFLSRKRSVLVVLHIGDYNEPIWIGACISVAADGGRDPPDRHKAMFIHTTCDVPQTVSRGRPWKCRCWIYSVGISEHRIRSAQSEPSLECVNA